MSFYPHYSLVYNNMTSVSIVLAHSCRIEKFIEKFISFYMMCMTGSWTSMLIKCHCAVSEARFEKKTVKFQTCGSVNLNNICAAKCNDKFKKISFMCAKRWRSYNNHILGCCLWMYTISYQLTVLRTLVLDHMTRLTFHCLQKLRKKIEYKATTKHLNLSLKISLRNVPNCFIATFS